MAFCFLNLTDAERDALVKVLLDRIAQIRARLTSPESK